MHDRRGSGGEATPLEPRQRGGRTFVAVIALPQRRRQAVQPALPLLRAAEQVDPSELGILEKGPQNRRTMPLATVLKQRPMKLRSMATRAAMLSAATMPLPLEAARVVGPSETGSGKTAGSSSRRTSQPAASTLQTSSWWSTTTFPTKPKTAFVGSGERERADRTGRAVTLVSGGGIHALPGSSVPEPRKFDVNRFPRARWWRIAVPTRSGRRGRPGTATPRSNPLSKAAD